MVNIPLLKLGVGFTNVVLTKFGQIRYGAVGCGKVWSGSLRIRKGGIISRFSFYFRLTKLKQSIKVLKGGRK
jgi:hypothetical protein